MIAGSENLGQFGAAFVQALLNGLWIGMAVALVVHVFIRAHRGLNAASRHAAWYAALVVIAALPAISFAVSLAHVRVSVAPVASALVLHVAPASSGASAAAQPPVAVPAASAKPSLLLTALQPVVLERLTIGVAIAFAAIAAARIVTLFVGLFGLARVKRSSRVVDPSLAPTLACTIARNPQARAVHVRISEALDAPAAAGFRTPAILLPAELVETLDVTSLDQIAMHEYAHLRRYDDWTNLAQRFIERFFWFSPAIWFIAGRIDLEREIACDDWVIAGADGVSGYADCLWHLAQDGRIPAFAATAPGAFLTRNQIAARIEHLLERQRDSAPTLRTAKLLAFVPVLAAAIALVVGQAPAIALHVQPQVATRGVHATVGVRMIAVSTGSLPTAPVSAAESKAAKKNCPLVKSVRLSAASTAKIEKTVQIAMQQSSTSQRILAAVHSAMAAQRETIRQTVHQVMHANQQRLHIAAPAIMAAATETDNLSYGPNDRNLIAHCTGCDLSGKNLRNADLHGLTLTGDDLSGADLRGANLRNSVLTGVDLSDAKLDGADLRDAVLTGSSIDGATFSGAKTDGIRLVGMQLTNAILAGASARSILSACAGCDLSGLDLHGRDLHGIRLDGADLHGTDFSGANLEGARFNGVDLAGVNFNGADLRHAEFNGCDLQNVDFSHAQTQDIQLQGSSLGSDGNGSN